MIERSACELLADLANGNISSAALTDAYLEAIRLRESRVRAFLHAYEQGAREQA